MDYKSIYLNQKQNDKLDILCFAAHPDDVELSCSATMIKHRLLGKKIGIIDLTKGELGTRGTPELRLEESKKSSLLMDIQVRINLGLEDGFFEHNQTNLMYIIEQIRRYQPEIICCNAPTDRHIDHGRAAKLVSEACFLSGLIKINSKWEGVKQNAHRPKIVMHYIQDRYIEPNFIVDVSDYVVKKMECIKAFNSQFYDANSKEPATPISGEEFLEFIISRMSEFGRRIGVRYGEGFVMQRTVGINDFSMII
ncbi:MAG: bacillithiol biosynthesis deacetylase BshB1 [Flavobacteriia bacterium]|nr:bacillithiol biosynthesis deacetylase BshB1 [Flavobacteriia bacterium]